MFKRGVEHLAEPYRGVVSRLLDALLSLYGDNLVSLVVYGSVARGCARRVWVNDKSWYWVLKGDYKFGEVIEIE